MSDFYGLSNSKFKLAEFESQVHWNWSIHLRGQNKLLQRDIEKLPFEAIQDRVWTENDLIKQRILSEHLSYNGTPINQFTKEKFEQQTQMGRDRRE